MEQKRKVVAPPLAEVPMVDPEVVRQMKELASMKWGSKAIAAELGVARNTVRRYLRGAPAGVVERPGARKLDEDLRKQAVGDCPANCVSGLDW